MPYYRLATQVIVKMTSHVVWLTKPTFHLFATLLRGSAWTFRSLAVVTPKVHSAQFIRVIAATGTVRRRTGYFASPAVYRTVINKRERQRFSGILPVLEFVLI